MRPETMTTFELQHRDRSLAGLLERLHGIELCEPVNGKLEAKAIRAPTNQSAALAAITERLQPARLEEIEDALIVVNELCKPPFDSDVGERIKHYRARLAAYPRDVVLTALSEWPDRHREWPEWKLLKDVLDALSWRRRAMLAAVQAMNTAKAEDELYSRPSEEDRAEMRAKTDRLLGELKATTQAHMRRQSSPAGKRAQIAAPEPPPSAFQSRLADMRQCDDLEAASLNADRENAASPPVRS